MHPATARMPFTLLMTALLLHLSCAPSETRTDTPRFKPINEDKAVFWDRQTTENAALLRDIVNDFNAQHDGLDIKLVHTGNYSDIYKKVTASIRAGSLPALAVAYETMTVEFIQAGALIALDDFIADPDTGFTEEQLSDFFPSVIATNTYPEFGNKKYSFPYTKSVLLLYFNRRVLARAGITQPPATWDEFLSQSRLIKTRTGKRAWAIDLDSSLIDGMIYSMGGDLLQDGRTNFHSPETLAVFKLLETLIREDLAYQNPPRTYNDQTALVADRIAFNLRPSSSIPYIAQAMDDPGAWGVSPIPQADPASPHTVLYGANLSIFNTSPDQQESAWKFIKFFTSPEVSVRWAIGTGYLPLHQSALQDPDMQTFWKLSPPNKIAFDSLAFARPEPNVAGWQEIRGIIQRQATAVITGFSSAEDAVTSLNHEANAVLTARKTAGG